VVQRYLTGRAEALGLNMSAVDWTGAFSTFTKSFRLSIQSLVLALGAYLVLQGEVTAGAMIAASILLGRALAPIEQIIGRWPQIARARHIIQTFEAADTGLVVIDGKLIEKPVLRDMHRILAIADRVSA